MIRKTFVIALLFALSSALPVRAEYEILWSDSFSCDTREITTVDLKADDPIIMSTGWAHETERETVLSAQGVTSGDYYRIAELTDDDKTVSNKWDYFIDNVDLNEDFILTHTTYSEGQIIEEDSVRARLASTLQDEGTFSGDFDLDTVGTAPGNKLTLLTTDGIVYDSHWAEGEDRVIKVRTISHEAVPTSYDLYDSAVDGQGTFTWDYLSEEVPSVVTYTLAYEIKNEAGTKTYAMECAQPVIKILPEPLSQCALLVLAAFCALRKRA
ncbi:hypothetical protein J6X96_02590 [bacterium]|nr:hypothetical protein [bacterium]